DRFVSGERDVLTDLVAMIATNIDDSDDVEVHRLRKRVLEREPQLLGLRVAETQRFHQMAVQAAAQRLRADAERAGQVPDEDAIAQRAGLVVLVAAAVTRHGWSRWVATGGTPSLGAAVLAGFEDFRGIAAEVVAPGDPALLPA
ncbi:MAG TPA: hypothetical protein VGO26_02765, partial [Amnibacterium sp.]|nr:hypothetical protein [Amnibacterium sp.]